MKNHYITKSFYCVGKNLEKCLNCEYCRLLDDETKGLNIQTTPKEINPLFSKFPVAINLFYGDPMIQIKNTLSLLERLEKEKHEGPVIIITKAPLKNPKDIASFDLDTHLCLSTFGLDSKLDGGSLKTFEGNLEKASKNNIKKSIEFRPIIYKINDSNKVLKYVFNKAKEYKAPIGYCGLQGKQEIIENIKNKGVDIKPFPGTKFNSHKKYLSKEFEEKMINLSKDYKIPIFKKTSCLVSFQHNLERDYNAHYYRSEEVGCDLCVMKEKCFKYYNSLNSSIFEKTKKILPYPHKVIYRKKHTCILAKQNICKSKTPHCFNIKGYLISTDKEVTTADVRATKWLTGLTIDAKMKESNQLSEIWFN